MRISSVRVAAVAAAILTALVVAGCGAATTTQGQPGGAATTPGAAVSTTPGTNPATVLVSGRGYPAHARIDVVECSSPTVVAPLRGCDSSHVLTIQTGADGTFRARFQVRPCPQLPGRPAAAKPLASHLAVIRHCYIGVPVLHGVDVAKLTDVVQVTQSGTTQRPQMP